MRRSRKKRSRKRRRIEKYKKRKNQEADEDDGVPCCSFHCKGSFPDQTLQNGDLREGTCEL